MALGHFHERVGESPRSYENFGTSGGGFGGCFVLQSVLFFFCFGDRKCRFRDIAIHSFYVKSRKSDFNIFCGDSGHNYLNFTTNGSSGEFTFDFAPFKRGV